MRFAEKQFTYHILALSAVNIIVISIDFPKNIDVLISQKETGKNTTNIKIDQLMKDSNLLRFHLIHQNFLGVTKTDKKKLQFSRRNRKKPSNKKRKLNRHLFRRVHVQWDGIPYNPRNRKSFLHDALILCYQECVHDIHSKYIYRG